MCLRVLLYHRVAERVTGQHRNTRKPGGDLLDIAHVLGDRCPAQALAASALPVAAQVQRVRVERAPGEEVEEVLRLAPRALPCAGHEQQRRPVRFAVAVARDDLQFNCHWLGPTRIPVRRLTVRGRARHRAAPLPLLPALATR